MRDYPLEVGGLWQIGKGLDAGVVHCQELEGCELLQEGLVFLCQTADLQLVQDQVAELLLNNHQVRESINQPEGGAGRVL